ncbi:zinc-dependent alcohol dehydrogenase family protein [Mucilaginibacter sp. KACC 22773]|uniref:zinc-dependent alcohol dehydrogenase family protein n=1 Tax=Mucilaginibacter sp. KACC 22773 TaxID=3025671 RepID=UPI00236615FA|nr:zinc-dependent alcohol dehydrogenase family protein [Mucilaginibacter sp. KACC 22773]WDF81319.1 zinc-dependent alcohol dehydrogenase family protein [Mucilaginibacter sp. KACC 22773]
MADQEFHKIEIDFLLGLPDDHFIRLPASPYPTTIPLLVYIHPVAERQFKTSLRQMLFVKINSNCVKMETPGFMQAMVFEKAGQPLTLQRVPVPKPADGQVLLKILACGICRTDLHIIDGELAQPKLPLIPGHEIIAEVAGFGNGLNALPLKTIVGVPWLGYTCGHCRYCKQGKENLCDHALFTGYTIDGGFAEYAIADARYCFPLANKNYNAPSSAPLLCAGLIGYRSYRMIDPSAINIGIYGFGAAAHIIIQIARAQGKRIFAFTRTGDEAAQQFARQLGAAWAGNSTEASPELLDAAMIFAPAGELIPMALGQVAKAGQVICGGIHMSEIPAFSYDLIWGERTIKSVANLTRQDGLDFFEALKAIPVHTQTTLFRLSQANEAIEQLRKGQINGAAVLTMD